MFTATVEVRPRLELTEADYKGLKVDEARASRSPRPRSTSGSTGCASGSPSSSPRSGRCSHGDFVTIDVKATAGGRARSTASRRTDYLYFVGSGEFGAGARRAARRHEARRHPEGLRGDGPERPATELAGHDGRPHRCWSKTSRPRRLPEADDEFAKTASEFDTIEQLRERPAHAPGRDEGAGGTRRAARPACSMPWSTPIDVDIPDTLIDDETEHRVAHAGERAERPGLTLDELLEAQGWDEARLREDSREHAIRGDQGRSGARRGRAGREDRGHGRRAGRRDHFPRSGIRSGARRNSRNSSSEPARS